MSCFLAAACSANSDVVFLLDSSDAVGQDDYQRELDFVKDTVNRLDVGPNRVQVGLATFGSQAQSVFNLNQHQTDQEVIQALSSAPMVGGTSNMQEALRFTTDNMFTPQAGVGSGTSHIVVMVTNGHSQNPDLTILQNPDLTILQGTTAQNNDIQIYTVGVGAGINEAELKGVASDPDTRYFYKADTFAALQGLDDILGPKICNEVPKDPSFLPAPTGCLDKADVVFLLDSSSSIGKDNFHKLEDFLKDVVQDLNISPDGVHVGLMQYSSYPSLEFSLGMHTSRYDALKAIDAVTYMGGGANTADALDYMRRLVFSQNSEARPGVPRIAVVITDGSSPNSGDVAIQANNARLDNIGLLAVGVGPNMNTAELQAIADDPDSQHMFTVSDYDQLPSITHQLIDATCTVMSTAAPMGTSGSSGTGTLPPDPCQDKLNCANYADDVCTLYVEWSKDNCQRTCGFCQRKSLSFSNAEVVTDVYSIDMSPDPDR
ncbi:hypothetical protein BaRGS_00003083 [Batillaria attramentaria]|uniref:Uncharacterized protein n=1 Tax=Batillaria attramentaria TaxID=370345 RepID=A0ABD0M3N6_9CAEN